MRTNHKPQIAKLRAEGERRMILIKEYGENACDIEETEWRAYFVAADLLEMHDATGISLDNWPHARALVEQLMDDPPITENHA